MTANEDATLIRVSRRVAYALGRLARVAGMGRPEFVARLTAAAGAEVARKIAAELEQAVAEGEKG